MSGLPLVGQAGRCNLQCDLWLPCLPERLSLLNCSIGSAERLVWAGMVKGLRAGSSADSRPQLLYLISVSLIEPTV
jgi:hypothetical protein